jgi:hypothetical protein
MNKKLFLLILSSLFLLYACEQQVDSAKSSFPSLQTKNVTLFEKSEQVRFEPNDGEDYFSDDEPTEAELNYFFNSVETGVQWLDNSIIREILVTLNQDNELSDKIDLNIVKKGEEKTVLLNKLQKNYDEELYKLKEGGYLGTVYSVETTYIGQRQNIITFSQVRNVYLGGPHGTYSTRYLNFDVDKKTLLSLNDVFPRDNQKKLKDLLWENYKAKTTSTENENTFVSKEKFHISTEFYFSPDGINFVYAPAVLTPFEKGETTLQLYWADVDKIITPEYSWTMSSAK